jgi:hypothetical protein
MVIHLLVQEYPNFLYSFFASCTAEFHYQMKSILGSGSMIPPTVERVEKHHCSIPASYYVVRARSGDAVAHFQRNVTRLIGEGFWMRVRFVACVYVLFYWFLCNGERTIPGLVCFQLTAG